MEPLNTSNIGTELTNMMHIPDGAEVEHHAKVTETEAKLTLVKSLTDNFSQFFPQASFKSRIPLESISLKKSKSSGRKFSRKRAMLDENFSVRKQDKKTASILKSLIVGFKAYLEKKVMVRKKRGFRVHVSETLSSSDFESHEMTNVVVTDTGCNSSIPENIHPNNLEQDENDIFEDFLKEYSLQSSWRYDEAENMNAISLNIIPSKLSLSQSSNDWRDSIVYANGSEKFFETQFLTSNASLNSVKKFDPVQALVETSPTAKLGCGKNEKGFQVVRDEHEAQQLVEKLKSGFEEMICLYKNVEIENKKISEEEQQETNLKLLLDIPHKTKDAEMEEQTILDTDMKINKYQHLLNTWRYNNDIIVNDDCLKSVLSYFPDITWVSTTCSEKEYYTRFVEITSIEEATFYASEYIAANLEWIPKHQNLFVALRALQAVIIDYDLPKESKNIEQLKHSIRKVVSYFFGTFQKMNEIYMEQNALKNMCYVLEARLDKWRNGQLMKLVY